MKRSLTLSAKITLIGIASLSLVMAVVGYLIIENIKKDMHHTLDNRLAVDIKVVESRVEEKYHDITANTRVIAKSRAIPRMLDLYESFGINRILNDHVEIYPYINYIIIAEPDGSIFSISTIDNNGKKIPSEQLLLSNVQANPLYVFSDSKSSNYGPVGVDPFLQTIGFEKRHSQWFIQNIYKKGVLVGQVIISANWEMILTELLNKTVSDLAATGHPIEFALITDGYDNVLSAGRNKGLNSTGNIVQDARFTPSEHQVTRNQTLDLGPKTNTHIVIGYDRRKALAALDTATRYTTTATIAGSAILGLLLFIILRRSIISRILVLHDAVNTIGEGNLNHEVPSLGKDELANLGNSINQMTTSLREKTTSIEQLNEQIELRKQALHDKSISDIELANTRKYIDGISDNSPQLMSYVDKNQIYRFVNKSYERWFEKPADHYIGKHVRDGLGTAAYENIETYINQVLSGETVTFDGKIPYLKDVLIDIKATYVPDINAQGEVLGFFATIEDITKIRESERELQAALLELNDQKIALDEHAIVAITDIKGTITYANRKFCDISGYNQDELIGENHRILNSGHHDTNFFRDMYLTISQGNVWHGEICNRAKDGREYWVDSTVAPLFDSEGKPRSYVAIRTDITLTKQAEKATLDAKHAAEESTRAKSEFLASMSHEIRTPMNGVLGMLNILAKTELNESQFRQISLAKSSADSLLVIINDILDFSKIEAGHLDIEEVDFNLRKLLDDFSESHGLRCEEKSLELIADISNVQLSSVRGDPSRLRQILSNLVGNAIKFTDSGEIILRASIHETQTDELIFYCIIQDTGIGIPKDKQAALFDAFTQADSSTTRKYGGTGLGLSITKQLCELMEGSISVKSAPGEGSKFQFSVVLKRSELSETVLPSVQIDKLNILVVDDNTTNRAVLNAQLEKWGANVTEAESGDAALNLLQQQSDRTLPKPFDLALLDMQMPGMDGAELGQRIRADRRLNSMKLVMMTSMGFRGDAKFFADLGFQGYFPKPVTTEDLFKALSVVSDDGAALAEAKPLVTSHYLQTLESAPSTDQETNTSQTKNTATRRILLVEDNFVNQEVAKGILEEFSLSIDTAGNGKEALELLNLMQEEEPYQAILMDCQMPIMDGYEATHAIRNSKASNRYTHIPIIAMTANAMAGDREKCLAAGMDDYISKPLNSEDISTVLEKWLPDTNSIPDFLEIGTHTSEPISTPKTESTTDQSPDITQEDSGLLTWDKKELLSRLHNKEALVEKILGAFLLDVEPLIIGLKQASEEKDSEGIKFNAHTIKGSAGNIAADMLAQISADIEVSLQDQDFSKIESQVQRAEEELKNLVIELEGYKPSANKNAS